MTSSQVSPCDAGALGPCRALEALGFYRADASPFASALQVLLFTLKHCGAPRRPVPPWATAESAGAGPSLAHLLATGSSGGDSGGSKQAPVETTREGDGELESCGLFYHHMDEMSTSLVNVHKTYDLISISAKWNNDFCFADY